MLKKKKVISAKKWRDAPIDTKLKYLHAAAKDANMASIKFTLLFIC